MREVFKQRGLRFIFGANLVSMAGSGMNGAAVAWFLLQATHSEMSLGWLIFLQTVPALLTLPFTGVIIDREDRRHLVMILDALRGAVILTVAVLALLHRVQIWQLYAMNIVVGAGFWMFFPSITALVQELAPEEQFVQANTLLSTGMQGGFLLAGSLVGFIYNHIGLGGVLLIDTATYVFSFFCYFFVRSGRHVVARPHHHRQELREATSAAGLYFHELREGISYLGARPLVMMIGVSWALFFGAMLSQGVITAPLSERILNGGAVGYGWLNAGWSIGAFLSAAYAARLIAKMRARPAIAASMAFIAMVMLAVPFTGRVFDDVPRRIALAVVLYAMMGSARGVTGIGLNTALMQMVPKHFMGRVQNTFQFFGLSLQLGLALAVGAAAHRIGLLWGFVLIAACYTAGALSGLRRVEVPADAAAVATAPAD